MPRYEFSEGTSNKFWQIDLSGTSFTTTYGKIGTSGQSTVKTFKSDAEAKKEYDKLVAEKVKKGYVLAGGSAEASGKVEEDDEPVPAKAAKASNSEKAEKPEKSTAPTPGARYFEMVEGSPSKLWEVAMAGLS